VTRYTARELRKLDAIGNFQNDRETALTVDCDVCGKGIGEACVNAFGREVPYPAHFHRLMKAEGRLTGTPLRSQRHPKSSTAYHRQERNR
jgi:hypothetical protein